MIPSHCIHHVYLFYSFDTLASWSLVDPEGTTPPPSWFSDIANHSLREHAFHMLEAPTTTCIELLHPGLLLPWPNHLGPGPRLRTATTLHRPLEWLQLACPKSAYSVLPVPSHGNHNKGSCYHFPSPPLVLPVWSPVVWQVPISWDLWV